MGPRHVASGIFVAALAALAGACGSPGAAAGSACSRANQCASQLCLTRGDAGVCASRCTSSAECITPGDVCGRFDYRGVDPDSGLYVGPLEDIVHVCRPRLTLPCSASSGCATPGTTCLGAAGAGVCATSCAMDGDCASRLCVSTSSAACGLSGTCAPQCDDPLECPRGGYCNLVAADATGHGRCESIEPITADAACGDASR